MTHTCFNQYLNHGTAHHITASLIHSLYLISGTLWQMHGYHSNTFARKNTIFLFCFITHNLIHSMTSFSIASQFLYFFFLKPSWLRIITLAIRIWKFRSSVAALVRCYVSVLPCLCIFIPPGCLGDPWAPGGRREHLICKHSDGRFFKMQVLLERVVHSPSGPALLHWLACSAGLFFLLFICLFSPTIAIHCLLSPQTPQWAS